MQTVCLISLLSGDRGRRDTNAVGVAEEEHPLAFTLSALGGFHPVARTGAGPESLEEPCPAGVGLGAVVLAHDLLDGLAGLVGVVEGDDADVVVQHVRLDDAVEDVAADEAKVTVDGGGSAAREVPHFRFVVRQCGIGVLQERDGNWRTLSLVK